MLFSKRMELSREYYLWIDSHKEKFIIRDCPENVITFLDNKGLINNERFLGALGNQGKHNIEVSFGNPHIIRYLPTREGDRLVTICPFGKNPKVGSFGCTECEFFICNDYIRNIVVCVCRGGL